MSESSRWSRESDEGSARKLHIFLTIVAVIALGLSLIGLVTDDKGISRNEARTAVASDLGYGWDKDGKIAIKPDGVFSQAMQATGDRAACIRLASAMNNIRPGVFELNKLLEACPK